MVKQIKRDKTAALLFSIFVGSFGSDRFYLGKKKSGSIKLGLTVISLFSLLLVTISEFLIGRNFIIISIILSLSVLSWWIIDIILIATNGYKNIKFNKLNQKIFWPIIIPLIVYFIIYIGFGILAAGLSFIQLLMGV